VYKQKLYFNYSFNIISNTN